MQWFNDLNVRSKMMVSAFVSAAFISVTCFMVYDAIASIQKQNYYLTHTVLEGTRQISQLSRNMGYIESYTYEMILNHDLDKIAEVKAKRMKLRADNDAILKDLEQEHVKDYNKEAYQTFKSDFMNWRNVQAKAMKFAEQNRDNDAFETFNGKNINVKKASGSMAALIKINNDKGNEVNQSIKKEMDSAIFKIIVFTILSAIFSFFISAIISLKIEKGIKAVVDSLHEVSKGNLKIKQLDVKTKDETGMLSLALNETVTSLKSLVQEVSVSVQDITAGSQEMNAGVEQTSIASQQVSLSTSQLAKGSQEISQNVEESAFSIGKMNSLIQTISEDAMEIADLGNATESTANIGRNSVEKAITKIHNIEKTTEGISQTISELGALSSEIGQIIDLIKTIAGQTNLLALNAAIEAARAGEHGKGFAVVAEEVKKLAEQSGTATDKINSMIKEIQSKTQQAVKDMNNGVDEVREGVDVVNDAGVALNDIIKGVHAANSKIQHINSEIKSVADTSDGIVRMIENISAVVEETAASSQEISGIVELQTTSLEEISANTNTLANIAEHLSEKITVFKI
ncbi:MAG: methyl-accepting chemotaxis protein [bacterium]